MNQFVLWCNMISFTLMFASAGLSYLVYVRNRAAWLRDYVIYSVSYGLWLLFATWAFFQEAYLTEPLPELTLIFARVRSFVSIIVAVFGGLFFTGIAGTFGKLYVRVAVFAVAGLVTAAIVILTLYPDPLAANWVTISFNIYLSMLSWFAFARLLRARSAPAKPMLPLTLYSGAAYFTLAALSFTLPRFFPPVSAFYTNAFAAGTFILLWAILMIGVNMRWISGKAVKGSVIPSAFLSDFRITRREAEILELLVTGKTSAEIGEALFISQRTVETHVYSIYRKSGAGNRIELLNRIAAFRSE